MKHGTQHTALQIANPWVSSKIQTLHQHFTHHDRYIPKTVKDLDGTFTYEKPQEVILKDEESIAVLVLLGRNIPSVQKITSYLCFSTKGILCHSDLYRKKSFQNIESTVQMCYQTFCVVESFIVFDPRCSCISRFYNCKPVVVLLGEMSDLRPA